MDAEVVDGVEVEVRDLMGEPVAADGLHKPVVNRSVLVQSVEEDVSWTKTGAPSVPRPTANALPLRNARFLKKVHLWKANEL